MGMFASVPCLKPWGLVSHVLMWLRGEVETRMIFLPPSLLSLTLLQDDVQVILKLGPH